ncbi:tail fiber assembly protein [Serratia liquefaciens]|uniref:tail fiber assembly protein n=1 Tax=Serratia liquefaciens TaxID=614 RepID=UPI003905DF61
MGKEEAIPHELELGTEQQVYEPRYFIILDESNYVVAMIVAFTQDDADKCIERALVELPQEVFESIGQDSQYVGSKVVQGPPRKASLTPEAAKAILSSKMADASVKIQTLQDAVDFGDATNKERERLVEWRKYRLALSRLDARYMTINQIPKEPD